MYELDEGWLKIENLFNYVWLELHVFDTIYLILWLAGLLKWWSTKISEP